MMRNTLITMIAGCMVTGMVGCNSNLSTENSLLKKENEELRSQYKEATQALQASDDDYQRMHLELRNTEEANSDLQTALNNKPETFNLFENISGVKVSMRDKDFAITVASDLLFNSGSATLKTSAKSTLGAVASGLNNNFPNKTIVVMGYTDTEIIKKSNFKSNWHLAFDRAWSVRDYLVSKGVDKNRIAIESWGPTKPLSTKAASRRVDIVVVDD